MAGVFGPCTHVSDPDEARLPPGPTLAREPADGEALSFLLDNAAFHLSR